MAKHRHSSKIKTVLHFKKRIGTIFHRKNALFIIAIAAGIFARVALFGRIPLGFNQDEASLGYDAYSILTHGTDRHGFFLPVMLTSWGSGMNALPAYLLVPFIAAFGLNEFAVRLPFLLAGIASIWLVYELLRKTTDVPTARVGAMLMAILPWPIMVSRWALEANMMPFIMLTALVLAVHSYEKPKLFPLASFAFAMTMYTYGTAYVLAPVMFAFVLYKGIKMKCWSRTMLLTSCFTFVIAAAPIAAFIAINSFGGQTIELPFLTIPKLRGVPRFETVTNIDPTESTFVSHAWANTREAAKMIFAQRDASLWNALPGYGTIYLFGMPLAVFGLIVLIADRIRKRKQTSIILGLCIASAALIPLVQPNINRFNILWPAAICCIAIALRFMSKEKIAVRIIGGIFAIAFVLFCNAYFLDFGRQKPPETNAGFGNAIRFAAAHTKGTVCITRQLDMPYAFVLFYMKEKPDIFRNAIIKNPGEEFERVRVMGRYRFGTDVCPADAKAIVLSDKDGLAKITPDFSATTFGRFTVYTR